MDKNTCNRETTGVIKELKVNGMDFPTTITVEYEVDGNVYELKENLLMKKEKTLFLGFIPVGYKTISQIESISGIKAVEGNTVKVMYDEADPKNAYLKDNVGKISWN